MKIRRDYVSDEQAEAAKTLAPRRSREQLLLEQVASQAAELEALRSAPVPNGVTPVDVRTAVASGRAQTYSARLALAGVIGAALITTVGTVTGVVLAKPTTPTVTPVAAPTSESPTSCRVANEEVYKTLATGQRNPQRLESINNEATDKQCGEEVDLARDILKTNPNLGKR